MEADPWTEDLAERLHFDIPSFLIKSSFLKNMWTDLGAALHSRSGALVKTIPISKS
jgi:hypothetical protein